MAEVAGDAAVYVDPADVESIARGLRTLLEDDALRASLQARGLARAASFTWTAAADRVAAIYAEVLRATRG
jgi:glycosyltransferase involved in cell wall biosynthesis